MEILNAYASGTVNSEMPASWVPPSAVSNPVSPPRLARHPLRDSLFGLLLFLAAVYTTMIVLASFNMMPFGDAILKPYLRLVAIFQKLLAPFM